MVENLDKQVSERILYELCLQAGPVESITITKPPTEVRNQQNPYDTDPCSSSSTLLRAHPRRAPFGDRALTASILSYKTSAFIQASRGPSDQSSPSLTQTPSVSAMVTFADEESTQYALALFGSCKISLFGKDLRFRPPPSFAPPSAVSPP